MANGIFGVGRPLGPAAPGLSGALNPLMFLGSGMATGNIGGAMTQMGNLQQNAQQLSLNRQQMAQDAIAKRAANLIAQQRLGAPTTAMRNFAAFQGMPEEQQQQYLEYQRSMSPFAGAQAFMSPLSEKANQWVNDAGENPDPAMTAQQATNAGFFPKPKPLTAGEYKEQTQAQQAEALVSEIDAALAEGAGTGPISAFRAHSAASPWLSWTVKLSPEEARLTSNLGALEKMLIAAMRGASVGPEEEASFRKTLPQQGQARELFDANLQTTKNNIRMLLRRGQERMGGAPAAETPEGAGGESGWSIKQRGQ